MSAIPSKKPTKILVVRNDRLGDFILSLPAFTLIKKALPNSIITALVPSYTREIAVLAPYIDDVVIDPGREGGFRSTMSLARTLRQHGFDAVITLFSTSHVGLAVFLARIPQRFAPATKIAQFFYNHRLLQRRSKSTKPEYAYNLDLARFSIKEMSHTVPDDPVPPFLQFRKTTIEELRSSFCRDKDINPDDLLIFIHPGHGGSANNISLEQYTLLARNIRSQRKATIVISCGPGEKHVALRLAGLLQGVPHAAYVSDQGLERFAAHIQFCDLFISSSTGPLHIAGALDRPTAAFYPRLLTSSALRWQTLNTPDRRLAFWPPEDAGEEELTAIDVEAAADKISQTYLLD